MITFRPAFATLFLPMVFSLLAEARRRGLAPQEPFASIQTLIVAGLPITPGMRAELERETGIPRIVEIAGASENLLAVECDERRGLHLVPDTCYAEVIDPTSGESAAPGERGRVVHTALIPWGSLFIAYDSGDLGTLDPTPCPCGLPSPRIKLHGRADDAFALGDRTLLPFDVQLAVEGRVPELAGARFAIMREALEAGRLELVMVDGEGSRALEEELERQLRECYQAPVRVRSSGRLPLQFKGVPPLLRERETG